MPKHFSTQQVSDLVARQLAPDDLFAAMQHLARCNACQAEVSAARNTERMFAALHQQFQAGTGPTDHLAYEQISCFVDQSMGNEERAAVQSHLECCHECAVEVREMEILWKTIQPAPALPLNQQTQKQHRLPWKPARRSYALASAAIALMALIIGIYWQWPTAKPEQDETTSIVSTASPFAENKAAIPTPTTETVEVESAFALMDHGQRVGLDSKGNLIGLTELPANYQQILKAVLSNQRAPLSPIVTELMASKGTLLGSVDSAITFDLISPVGKVLSVDRPTFRWQKVAGAESYSVVLLDQKLNVVASGKTAGVNYWTPVEALPRNQVLRWQVTAQTGERQIISPAPPLPEARFKILPLAKSIELTRAAKEYANSHLLLGSLYAEAGLTDEAEREFRSLQSENPKSRLAQKLHRSVQTSQKRNDSF